MTTFIAFAFLIAAFVMGARGFYIWNHCGYDCSAIPLLALDATACVLVSVVLAILGASLFLGMLFEKGK